LIPTKPLLENNGAFGIICYVDSIKNETIYVTPTCVLAELRSPKGLVRNAHRFKNLIYDTIPAPMEVWEIIDGYTSDLLSIDKVRFGQMCIDNKRKQDALSVVNEAFLSNSEIIILLGGDSNNTGYANAVIKLSPKSIEALRGYYWFSSPHTLY
jgi:hypothetical protein